MKKILHIIDSLHLGGAGRLLVDVINSLNEYEHHIVILNGPDGLKHELRVPYQLVNLNKKSHREMFRQARTVRKYIREHKIDIVHSHLYFSNILARMAAPASVPVFNSLHIISSLDNYSKNKLSLYLEKLTYRKRHYIIAVSKEVLADFDKYVGIKGPSTVLYNFIDDAFFRENVKTAVCTRPLRLVAVGNLRYQKNYPYLIEAFKQMPKEVTLDIYGEGSLRESLQSEIDRHRLNITLKGAHSQLYRVLPDYDAFVMSSFFEGQPLSLLEAIACGLPAILSDIPVLKEVTGEHAVYFDINNPSDIVEKVKQILGGELNIVQHTRPALDRISSFAKKEFYLMKLRQLYRESLEQKAS